MKTINYNQKVISIYDSADVIVVGGGTSGIVAAISALVQKQSVIILEKGSTLGGSAIRGLVAPYMATGCASGKLTRQINEEYLAYDKYARQTKNIYSIFFNGDTYATFIDNKIRELNGIIYYDATFIDTIIENNTIKYVVAYITGNLYAIEGKTFIDASAEALVAKNSNILVNYGNENHFHQAVSLRFELANVDKHRLVEYLKTIDYMGWGIPEDHEQIEFCLRNEDVNLNNIIQQGVKEGLLKDYDLKYLQAFYVPGKKDVFSFNCPELPNVADSSDPKGYSYFIGEGRQMILRIVNFLKKYFPGFENCYISKIADMLGIRESVRIVGDYVLTIDDYINRAKHEDYIAKGDWYVDVHDERHAKTDDKKYDIHYNKGESYDIPYRCLISHNCNNLIVVGRIISTDFRMEASIRIQPTLRDIAEMAGFACHYSIINNIDLNKINGKLLKEAYE